MVQINLFTTQERVTDVGNKLTVTKENSSMVSHCTWNKIKTIYWNQVGPSGALLGTNAFLCPLFLVCKEKASAGSHRYWSQKGENAETKEKPSRYNSDEHTTPGVPGFWAGAAHSPFTLVAINLSLLQTPILASLASLCMRHTNLCLATWPQSRRFCRADFTIISVLISHHFPLAHCTTVKLGKTHQILSELSSSTTAIPLLEMLSPWLIPFPLLVFLLYSNVTSSKSSTPTPTPPPASRYSLSICIWNYIQ